MSLIFEVDIDSKVQLRQDELLIVTFFHLVLLKLIFCNAVSLNSEFAIEDSEKSEFRSVE